MKKRTKEYRLLGVVAVGLIYAVFTYALCAALFSAVAYMFSSPGRYLGIFSMLSLFFSGAVTGITVARKKGDVRVFAALLSSLAVTLLLLGVSLIAKGGISGAVIINCVIFTFSAIVFSIAYREKRVRSGRRFKRA